MPRELPIGTLLDSAAGAPGGLVEQPSLVQMGRRLTPEGGTDVSVPLR